jgi:hypothetical protein
MHALLLAQAASRVAAVDNSIAWHTVAIERSTSGSVLMIVVGGHRQNTPHTRVRPS